MAAALLVVGAIVTAVDWPVMRAQALALDDQVFVSDNILVTHPGWTSLGRFFGEVLNPSTINAYYMPLSMTSLMVDYALGGRPDDQRVFHRTNLALHVLSTLLLLLILDRLFGALLPAATVALLFGLHPLMVEPLASIGERKTLLAECLAFASVLAYVESCRAGRAWRAASVGLFGLALLSKPSVTPLPLLLVLMDGWPLRRLSWKAVFEKWTYALLSLASAIVTVLSVVRTWQYEAPPPSNPLRMVFQICHVVAFYVGKMTWPRSLSPVYAPAEPFALSNPVISLSVAAIVVLSLGAALAWPRTRGPLTGWAIFLVALVPTFGILAWSSVAVIAYDRYVYFPVLGIALLLASGLVAVWNWRPTATALRWLVAVVLVAIVVAEARASRGTLAHWQNSVTLWRHIVAVSPGRPEAHSGLGAVLQARFQPEEALREYRRAVEVGPEYSYAQYNLGMMLSVRGQHEEAIVHLRLASEMEPRNPEVALELGRAAQRAGRLDEAAVHLQRALEIRPDYMDARDQLGLVRVLQGRTADGIEILREALRLAPGDAHPHFSLAIAWLLAYGLDAMVVDHLEEAVRLRPGWITPIEPLAWIRAASPVPAFRNGAEALRLSAQLVELTGGRDVGALDTRAAAEAEAGQFAQASRTAEEALRMARESGADSVARLIDSRLALYRRGVVFQDVGLRGRGGGPPQGEVRPPRVRP